MQNQFRDITVSSLNNEILGEECSTSFNRLKPRVNPRSLVNSRLGKAAIAVEDRFWNKKFHAAPEIKLNGKVTCVHFSADGQHCAVTSSTKVVAYNSKTGTVAKEFTRFKGVAYGGKFRNDSRLLVAGGEEKYVRVFDSASRSVLRTFQGHKDSIHATEFLETEPSIVLSGSDDCTMKTWDMRSALLASEFLGHSDRIRTVSQNSQGKYIISGSYDHVIKVWDPRKGSESVLSMEHGSPVQSVLSLPGGSLIASAGDNEIKVWDILNGGSLVHSFSNHQKQITALSLDGTKERLVSASLDQFVKIYDLSNYEVTSSLRFDDPILSMDIASDNQVLAVGTVGGYLYTRIRSDVITKSKGSQELANSSEDEEDGIPSGIVQDEDYYLNQLKRKEDPESSKSSSVRRNRAYFTRGEKAKINADNTDIVVSQSKKPKLRDYEELFRKFKHSEAMGKALRTNDPSVVSTVLEELNRRDALNSTISSIDEEELVQLLSFLRKNITNPLHSKTLIPIANLLLDAHTDHLDASPDILRQLHFLRESVSSEIATQMDLHRMKGNMDMILAAALLSSNQ